VFDVAPAGFMEDPTYLQVSLIGIPVDGELVDYDLGEVGPAYLAFEFLNASQTPLCVVLWDAEELVSVPPGTWNSDGAELYNAWELRPVGRGFTDCGGVDASLWGTDDLREWIALSAVWSVGVGEITPETRSVFEDAFGADWPSLEPVTFSTWVSADGEAFELGYAFQYEQDCGVVDPYSEPLLAPRGPVDRTMLSGRPLFLLPLR
jgi:hypothetical protein